MTLAVNDQRRGGPRQLGDGGGKAQARSLRPSWQKKLFLTHAQFGIALHDLPRRAAKVRYCCCAPSQKMVNF